MYSVGRHSRRSSSSRNRTGKPYAAHLARLDYLLIYLRTQVQSILTKIIKIVATMQIRVSNPVFTETEKPGNPEFFQNRKNRFLAACKPRFSVFNFDLQMSHYTTILTQTAYNVHDSMFLFVYIYHWRPGSAGFTLHSSKSFIDIYGRPLWTYRPVYNAL